MLIIRQTWKLQADVSTLIVKTFGSWTPATSATIRIIASKTMTKTRLSFSQVFSNLLEQYLFIFGSFMLEY